MKSLSFPRTLKCHVFPKMGNSLIGVSFVPAPDIKHNPAMDDLGGGRPVVHDTNAVS
jgi:hypothetical protein